MTATTNRRTAIAALAGAAFTPMAIAATRPAFAEPVDYDMLRHFETRQDAMRAVYAEGGEPTPVYYANHDRASAAEMAMLTADATTPAGVARLLWTALPHIEADRWIDEAVTAGRFEEVHAKSEDLDFGPRLIVAALAALQRMEG